MKRLIFLPVAFVGVQILRLALLNPNMGPTRRAEIGEIVTEYQAKVGPWSWVKFLRYGLAGVFAAAVLFNLMVVIYQYDTPAGWVSLASALLSSIALIVIADDKKVKR